MNAVINYKFTVIKIFENILIPHIVLVTYRKLLVLEQGRCSLFFNLLLLSYLCILLSFRIDWNN